MKESRILRNIPVWDNKTRQWVEIDLDVEIAVDVIAKQLAHKAYNNKSRRTRALNGLVEVRRRGTKATPVSRTYPQTEAFHAAYAKEP